MNDDPSPAPGPAGPPRPPAASGPEDRSNASVATTVPWPPPGLERLQGDLWGAADRLGVGAFIFALPLLAALTVPQDPWGLGIYGDAWWVVFFTSVIGLWILLAGHVHLFRALRRWRSAVRSGYTPRTVALVLADRPGDTGFLVQGARAYSLIGPRERRALLTTRLVQAGLMLTFGLWLSAGFLVGVLLSARGMLQETGLAVWTLAPLAVAVAGVAVLKAWENGVLGRARKRWYAEAHGTGLALDEVEAWHAAVVGREGSVAVLPGKPRSGGGLLRASAVATVLVALAVLFGAAGLVIFSGLGPVLSQIAVPRFSTTSARAAKAEALRSLRLPADPSISPRQAGEALWSLTSRPDGADIVRQPPRSHDRVFTDDEDQQNPTGIRAELWARELVPRLSEGLDPAVVAYLRQKGEHPALEELRVLARAPGLDEIGAGYTIPFPEEMSVWALPIPRYGRLREAARAQIGAAVEDAASGRTDVAETRLREVISAGQLLGDEGSTLIANLIGFVMAGEGAEALANLYDATGRAADAEALRASMDAAERVARRAGAAAGRIEISDMPDVVTDTAVVRGIRWEFLSLLEGLGPCLNLNRVVFGPPDDHGTWSNLVDARLAGTEGDEALLALMRRGFRPAVEGDAPLAARIFGQVAGQGAGACAHLAAAAR